MTRAFTRLGRAAATVGLLIAAGALPVLTATPAAASACSSLTGVTVVVDYQGSISVGCAPSPATGLDALSEAGSGYTFVPRQPGLVCQINSEPNPCNGAKTNAYWSYWHAARGGHWSYSNDGAGTYSPAPGSVEGWSFGAGSPPGIDPPDPAAVTTTASTTISVTSGTPSAPTSTSRAASSTSRTTNMSTPISAPSTRSMSSSTRPLAGVPATSPSSSASFPAQSSSSSSETTSPSPRASGSSESVTAISTTHSSTARASAANPPPTTQHPTSTPTRATPRSPTPPSASVLTAVPPKPASTSTNIDSSASPADQSLVRTASATPDTTGSAGGWWGIGLGIAAVLGLGGAALAVRLRRPGP